MHCQSGREKSVKCLRRPGKYPVVQGLLDWDRTIHSLQWIRESIRHLISTADQKLTW
jgi:hypothetical protein